MDTILYEEKTDSTHSVVLAPDSIFHITSESNINIPNLSAEESTHNVLKVIVRNVNIDNFGFEYAFHQITQEINCKNTTFKVFVFDEVERFEILQVLITFINYSYNTNIVVESTKNQYIIKRQGKTILQSFF